MDGPFGQMHVWSSPPVTGRAPVVLLHPSPYSGAYYADLMGILSRDRQTIAIDTPGFGASAPPPAPVELEDYAHAMAKALEALDLPESGVDVVGFHTGAMLAVELAFQRPDRVRRLALAGLPFYAAEDREAAYRAMPRPLPIQEDGQHLLTYWDIIVRQRHPDMSLARAQQRYNDFAPSFPDGWWAYHALYRYPAEARIPLIGQPVLLLLIHEVLLQATLAAAPMFQHCERIDLPQLGKNAFDLGADVIAQALRAFFDRSDVS